MSRWRGVFGRGAIAPMLLVLAAAIPATAQQQPAPPPQPAQDTVHLGVRSCAGNNCHGAVQPLKTSHIEQNEYLIWSQKDKHSKAFAVLREERGLRIAHNLGLQDAEHAKICLDCHADDVAPNRRGPSFQISDGVGCEACHGGAGGGGPEAPQGWLGTHISGTNHAADIAAGMYPTDRPIERAERCIRCHIGDDKRFANHDIMGAGHPPMPFELDTFTAIQPAHFVVDKDYVERKGRPNDMQFWAVGQAVDLRERMDKILDKNNVPKGANPELALFDCQACHHAMNQLQWQKRPAIGLGPGKLRLYDATAVMLRTIASRVSPDAAKDLGDHLVALHRATVEPNGDYWAGVQREATAIREAADKLVPALAKHNFDKGDAKALAQAVIALSTGGEDLDYSSAQQQTMALESIVAAMKAFGFADEGQLKGLDDALGKVYEAAADDQKYRPDTFVQALKDFESKLP
jgi:Cytochrome c554 and c-prime